MMIDTHCHISKYEYEDLIFPINNMGNNLMVTSGANQSYNEEVLDVVNKYKNIYGVIGIHPDEANVYLNSDLEYIKKNISNKKIVGIGEIGLDFYHNKENKDKQKDLFIKQLNIARKYNCPVVIHSRDSIEETYNILKEYKDLKIDIHCFSGSMEMATKFINLGAKLGIGGTLTFKNNKKTRQVVSGIDLKDVLLETDSPYLTPEPNRGKKNEPYNIIYVARKIAEIKNISEEQVLIQTTKNAKEFYNI